VASSLQLPLEGKVDCMQQEQLSTDGEVISSVHGA
jgi:hypothetical protein